VRLPQREHTACEYPQRGILTSRPRPLLPSHRVLRVSSKKIGVFSFRCGCRVFLGDVVPQPFVYAQCFVWLAILVCPYPPDFSFSTPDTIEAGGSSSLLTTPYFPTEKTRARTKDLIAQCNRITQLKKKKSAKRKMKGRKTCAVFLRGVGNHTLKNAASCAFPLPDGLYRNPTRQLSRWRVGRNGRVTWRESVRKCGPIGALIAGPADNK